MSDLFAPVGGEVIADQRRPRRPARSWSTATRTARAGCSGSGSPIPASSTTCSTPPPTTPSSRRADRRRCRTDRIPPPTGSGCSRRSASTSVDQLFADIPEAPAGLPPRPAASRSPSSSSPPGCATLAGRNRTDLASFLGRRRLPPLEPAGGRPAPPPRRVVHGLHAVPARGQPGHAPEHLRVRVADRRARRPRRRLGLALRRRRGDRRGRADDLPGDPPRAGPRQPRRPSALPRDAADLLRRRPRARGDPARRRRRRRPGRPTSPPSSGCWPSRTARSPGVHRGPARLPRPARADAARSASSPTPRAPCSSRSSSRVASPSSRRPARTGRTSRPARASRSASRRSTAARTSGILASTDALVRQIPGRLVGMTTDLDGQRAFVMTMRAREQDIRRDKAASNICTNQALLALAASIYLATIGPHGLRDVAALGAARAARARGGARRGRARRGSTPGRTSTSSRSASRTRAAVHRRLLERGILAGLVLADAEPDDPSLADGLLVCATEVTTVGEIARFADALGDVLARPARRSASRPAPASDAAIGRDRRGAPSMSVTGPAAPADPVRARPPGPRRRQDPAPAQGRPRPHPGRGAPRRRRRPCRS